LWSTEYYTRIDGRQPVADWRASLAANIRASVDAKLGKLRQYGLQLLDTEILDNISGEDDDLFELRNETLKWRIALYFDRGKSCFILLHGFRKHQRKEPREIEKARHNLHEYLY
jgi:phage-related protein